MTISVICLMLFFAAITYLVKKIKISAALLVLVALILFCTGYGFPGKQLLNKLQAAYINEEPYQWTARNAIVLLGAGTEKIADHNLVVAGIFSYARIIKAAQVYSECKTTGQQCTVYVSGGDPLRNGTTEAVIYGALLQKLGVPKVDQILERTSRNTWQNALFISDLLKHDNFNAKDTVVLVTGGIQMQRGLLYFSYFGIAAKPSPADYIAIPNSWLPSSYNMMLTDAALHEYVGIWRFHLYNFLGLNDAARLPAERHPPLSTPLGRDQP